MQAALTALSLADNTEVLLFFAGPHMQLTLAVIGGAIAATHRLMGVHTLRCAHTLSTLGVTDCPKRTVAARLIYMEERKMGVIFCVCRGLRLKLLHFIMYIYNSFATDGNYSH